MVRKGGGGKFGLHPIVKIRAAPSVPKYPPMYAVFRFSPSMRKLTLRRHKYILHSI